MADLFFGRLITMVMQKATDPLVQQVVEMWGIKDQRERLHDKLLAVQDVLSDAEHQGASKLSVKNWMLKLKSAAYDADDVLDEFCYEELRRDAVRRGHTAGNNVSGLFSPNNPALFRYKMSKKLKKVVGMIEELVAKMREFGFVQGQRVQVVNQEKTGSVLVESKVVGRDGDKKRTVKLLLEASGNADLTVVPVVGMGGIGKTTLVQLVYDDPRVKEHFKLSLWICVSEEFNINGLVKSIIDLIIDEDCKLPVDNTQLLQRRLCRELSDKRYLLVLDDVWDEFLGVWEQLKAIINCGDSGSVIIVTTRSGKVASIMGTVGRPYDLGCLGEEDSWSLFHKRAFSKGVKECEQLVDYGRKMVQNCGGLPLAINTLGSLMSDQHEVEKWTAILEESNIWVKLPENAGKVLPVLRLSYNYLPPYMKQCFAFCAVFPKDFEMDKEKLIQYWMANGFIPSDGIGNLKMNGNDIFDLLAWRSFFQDIKQISLARIREDGCRSKTTCKMHDLMHDLAQSIMGDQCLSILELPAKPTQQITTARHISLTTPPSDINVVMNCYPSIRSIIFNTGCHHMRNIGFVKSNSLRILDLGIIKHMERLILTPGKMKHLRYLEISKSLLISLPEEISSLYLLQTLRLSKCVKLEKLPDDMQYMKSLRHLHIENCFDLQGMPSGFGQLTCLQTLTNYIIGPDACNGIGELENLDLHGQLHLYNLTEVRDAADATKAKLVAKQNLRELMLCWRKSSSELHREVMQNYFEVLDALKPCNQLKILHIKFYQGDKFPAWVTEYQILENLTELYIIECSKCTNIPSVGKLPFLRILKLKDLYELRHLCSNSSTSAEGAKDAQIVFPSLEKLELNGMRDLHRWFEGEVGEQTSMIFTQLKTLCIYYCRMLVAMPIAPLLEELSIEGNRTLSHLATGLTTLRNLALINDDGGSSEATESLSFQPWEALDTLSLTRYNSIVPIGANEGEESSITATQCRELYLDSCNFNWSHIPSNTSLWFWKCFTFLQTLNIEHCDSLIYWPVEVLRSLNNLKEIMVLSCDNFRGTQLESPIGRSITGVVLLNLQRVALGCCYDLIDIPQFSTSIKGLYISYCSKLECLPEWLGSMVALKYLSIDSCESLNSLPSSIEGLTSLEDLSISECPNLADLPKGMEGLKALVKLQLIECPKIRVLPQGLLQQLSNLDQLWIEGCPHLEMHFRIFGTYRRQISEIRIAKVGEKGMSRILRDLQLFLVSSCKITCFYPQS